MKPLRLQLENFASFRGEAAVLDFSSLELFAIAGATGAGKSTLLDAIIFALYGAVPRLGRRANEMISLGADRMSVALDFRMGDATYRVTRQARRRGPGTAQLEQFGPGDGTEPLADGVRDVNDRIERLVGLNYDAFTQAVILPQGEFQRFLKSKPADQRDILSKILRLEIYERMRSLAAEKSRRLDRFITERERRLAEDYAEATADALGRLEDQAATLRQESEALTGGLHEAEALRDVMRAARAKTRELEGQRFRRVELDKQAPGIAERQAHLEAARKAAPVLPQLRAERTAEVSADAARRSRDAAVVSNALAQKAHAQAQKQVEEAEHQAQDIPRLELRMASLSEAIGRLQPRPGLAAELATAKKQQLAIASVLIEARAAHQRTAAEYDNARTRLDGAEGVLAAVQYDRVLYELLDGVREEASGLVDQRVGIDALAADIAGANTRLTSRNEAAARADTEADGAREKLDDAARESHEVERQLAEALHLAAAAILRQELQTGLPCPVCEHPVAQHPPALATPAVDALERWLHEARRAETRLRGIADKVMAAAAEARAAASAEQRSLNQQVDRHAAMAAAFGAARATLAQRVGGAVVAAPDMFVEDQVRQQYRLAAVARERHDAARSARDEAERAVRTQGQETERLRIAANGEAERAVNQEKRIAELTRQIAEIDDAVGNVTQASDPVAERADLDRQRSALGAALGASQARLAHAMSELAGAAARLEAGEAALAKALSDLADARATAAEALRAAGFADAAEAIQAELGTAAQEQLSEEIGRYRTECAAVDARIAELSAELGDGEVAQEQLDEAETRASELRDRLLDRQTQLAALGERLQAMADALRRAEGRRAELDQRRLEHAVYRTLALDLRSDRFQAFLLQETFGELVAGASFRLWELTGRYRFDWHNETFYVVDHDNARQMRSADTLSGGETFLASLALALQLSDQVQKSAGATALDSLFIDEGFGTLDPEALDAAAGAIENLPVGGRMVGIITHLEELSLRLPARVRVGKTAAGSRLTVDLG